MIFRIIGVLLILGLHGGSPTHSKTIVLNPNEVPEGAKRFQFTVKRTDGQAFTTQPGASLWVGVALRRTLVKFKAKPDQHVSPRLLTVELEDLDAQWSPAPRAEDTLLVTVYLGNEPITAAANLRVVAPKLGLSLPPLGREVTTETPPLKAGSFIRVHQPATLCFSIINQVTIAGGHREPPYRRIGASANCTGASPWAPAMLPVSRFRPTRSTFEKHMSLAPIGLSEARRARRLSLQLFSLKLRTNTGGDLC